MGKPTFPRPLWPYPTSRKPPPSCAGGGFFLWAHRKVLDNRREIHMLIHMVFKFRSSSTQVNKCVGVGFINPVAAAPILPDADRRESDRAADRGASSGFLPPRSDIHSSGGVSDGSVARSILRNPTRIP